MLYSLIIFMSTTSSVSHWKQWMPKNQGWSLFPSEWGMTANDNNVHDLHQPAVSDSSVLCTGACVQVSFWVVCLLFGASYRVSVQSEMLRLPSRNTKGRRTWSGSDSSQTRNMNRRESRRSAFRTTFRLTGFFISGHVTKCFRYLLLHWSPSLFLLSSDYFNWCVNASKRVQPGCDYGLKKK